MKKRFILAIAAVALMAVSCSMNETEEINIVTADAISLNPNTAVTRASISNLTTLRDDNNGFAVYADNGTSPSTWHTNIAGSNNHFHDGSKWNFKTQVAWPTAASEYPMTFLAFHPAQNQSNGIITNVTSTHPNVNLNVTVKPLASDQRDLLAGKNTAESKPSSGTLSMGFKHILSKVFFTVSNQFKGSANTTQDVYVLAIGFKNLHTTDVYNVRTGLWTTNTTGQNDYNYYNKFESQADAYTPVMFNSADKGKFYANTAEMDASYMMLLPQNPDRWDTYAGGDPESVQPPLTNDAYVRMLYRVEEKAAPANDDFIGYKSAVTHPNYDGSQAQADNYTGALYVMVGYSYDPAWLQGNGYQYDIPVPGSTGGRLINKNYFDDKGNETDLPVIDIEVPEVIIPGDDYIHLSPIVTPWDDLDGQILDR